RRYAGGRNRSVRQRKLEDSRSATPKPFCEWMPNSRSLRVILRPFSWSPLQKSALMVWVDCWNCYEWQKDFALSAMTKSASSWRFSLGAWENFSTVTTKLAKPKLYFSRTMYTANMEVHTRRELRSAFCSICSVVVITTFKASTVT